MNSFRKYISSLGWLALWIVVFVIPGSSVQAQGSSGPFPQETELQQGPPLTNQEFVSLLYQLPRHPDEREKLIEEVRKRGIGFPLTEGLRSLIATKSGNDSDLRHALEEADRRRANPTAVSPLPPAIEATELLERTRKATLGASNTMPDYLVRQQITRSYAQGNTRNWIVYDRLSLAVSFREGQGEQYKLLSVNGMPPGEDEGEGSTYARKLSGSTSTGEFVTILSELFLPQTRTEFTAVDTDQIRGRATVIFEYVVKRDFSHHILGWADQPGAAEIHVLVGYRGRIWVDRETNRVLRLEDISTEIPAGFPITAASSVIDYDWVTINEQAHLLPSRAIAELTTVVGQRKQQTRNDILFRGYRKFGTEVKITDIDEKDFPPDQPEPPDNRATTPPVLKPAPKKPSP